MGIFGAKNKPRVELSRAAQARRGLITLVVLALILLVIFGRSSGIIGGPDKISAQLQNAGGSLAGGADVKMQGIIVGKVDGITRAPDGGVRVGISMHGNELSHIPDNVVARILPATVFGTSYVDLTAHGKPASQSLKAGAVVPADRTQGTLELQQALDDIDTLVKVLQPAKLSATLSSIAMSLDGRGAELGRTIDSLDGFLKRVQPQIPAIKSDINKLATNLELVERVAPELLDGTQDALAPLHTIAAHGSDLAKLLTGGRQVADEAGALTKQVRPNLKRFTHAAAKVLQVYYDERHAAFTEAFRAIRLVGTKLATVVHHGWVDNTLILQMGTPPYYTAKDCPRFGKAKGNNCAGGS
ncbi:MAG TPA: MlaD family protein [Marmoricola sp.]